MSADLEALVRELFDKSPAWHVTEYYTCKLCHGGYQHHAPGCIVQRLRAAVPPRCSTALPGCRCLLCRRAPRPVVTPPDP